ncbi:MAG: hypothetical protein EZS26_003662 [Candidatus Ordinivivax streblomastigis]|uniref:Uncharacterized protein n=1 Tax=Candidatus Ordinivivax streblomastigis TaxID=2540710 RepID=A0A5M8NY34_9BACT|nr:MAG: hypothetical protein EZS26_003662 [Candidatus Ordinivivax streblomastigis]
MPENGKTNAVIPSEALDEVFDTPPVPMDIDYPLERIENEPEDEANGEPDADRAARIKEVIDRHEQSLTPKETADEYGKFDITDFLS